MLTVMIIYYNFYLDFDFHLSNNINTHKKISAVVAFDGGRNIRNAIYELESSDSSDESQDKEVPYLNSDNIVNSKVENNLGETLIMLKSSNAEELGDHEEVKKKLL